MIIISGICDFIDYLISDLLTRFENYIRFGGKQVSKNNEPQKVEHDANEMGI